MTDAELAAAFTHVSDLDRQARAQWANEGGDEQEQAIRVVRLATPLTRAIAGWIAARAVTRASGG